jgi:hypothetical protein
MATFKAHMGMDSMWISTSTDRKIKANEHSPADRSWPVKSDEWGTWLVHHPNHTIAVWNGGNYQTWFLSHGADCAKVVPPNQGAPWWPQQPATWLENLPQWAIDALIDLGEVTTPEIEEAKAVESVASMHAWGFRGMALEICMKPIMQRFGAI